MSPRDCAGWSGGTTEADGLCTGHQRVGFDINFSRRRLKGWTEITINPTDPMLRQVRLNARQCEITKCTINGKTAPQVKYDNPYSKIKIHDTATVHQHGMLRKKIEGVLHDPPEFELVVTLPSKLKIEAADPFNIAAQHALAGRGNVTGRATPDVPDGGVKTPAPITARPDNMYTPFMPLVLRIEFVLDNIRDGFTFVGCEPGDMRYPHAYTTNSPIPGAACCLFPTLDGIHERWTWEIEVTVPRTISDIDKRSSPVVMQEEGEANGTITNGINGSRTPKPDEDVTMDEDGDLDMVVVCSGDFVDEEPHPTNPTKKIVKFTQPQAVAPQHISIAVGPFERVNLSEFRDQENEDAMAQMAKDVIGYCLPGRDADLKNTCMFMPKAIDYAVKEYGAYTFSNFKLCFVDDLATDTVESASLALCSNSLLFPEAIVDPLWDVTKKLTYALTTQWSGIQIVPKDWADIWVIIGLSYWMTGQFLRTLFGNNEYRFRLKKDAERICELDIGRPSLYAQGFQVPIEPASLDFIKLKAPVVLTILERRLWKVSSSMVLNRVVRKTFLSAEAGDLKNGLMSTAHFIRLCEKNGHNKLDAFFQQWVYGSGYPKFEISQRFNKKRMIVELGIRQVQGEELAGRKVTPEEFMKDALDRQKNVVVGPTPPLFTGPMTIRIHEADGTPYEHVVDIKDAYMKLEIPYNTKYKRLKRSRRQKERAAAGAGVDVSLDAQQNDDVLLYCLGDVLQGEEEVDDWRLVDWSKEDEERMAQESFEWIRMDADFEWICALNIGQPDYMFLSQLQQDRDVIAQYDSVRHFAKVRESALVSTILVRTLMDRRYYYGIRVEAAMALARCATAELDWVGQFHLQKAFQEFFCYPGSQIPRGNDFSDFTAYYVQNAIPRAMSRIRNLSGACPGTVQKWILDVLRYNDNSNNQWDDCYYVANLMRALADTLSPQSQEDPFGFDLMDEDDDDEEDGDEYSEKKLHEMALAEIDRYQRMDQWQPTYRNIVSEVALGIRKDLMLKGIKDLDYRVFMAYTREGTLDTLRVKAFDCLIDLGALRNPNLAPYICYVMGNDPSPFVRRRAQMAFGRGLGLIACEQAKPVAPPNGLRLGEMIIEDPGVDNAAGRQEELAKETIDGAITALKKAVSEDPMMKEALWTATTSPEIGLIELRFLLDICDLLYTAKISHLVILKTRKRLRVKHLGKGLLHFTWKYPDLTQRRPVSPTSVPAPPPLQPPPHHTSMSQFPRSMPIKLITNPRGKSPPTTPGSGPVKKRPQQHPGSVRRTPSISHAHNSSQPHSQSQAPNGTTAPRIILKLKVGGGGAAAGGSSTPGGANGGGDGGH
ncbi:hypothetical protein FN846DRAFT_547784 [Sphaerosporella brunnea]|uniref:Transcription initiation factor TFIID subunit 2 n=1 Tax=Sphaerosporella brunnea TaxID=1250544 RepID=A0A5J5EDZ9_9PEZI|nr:hypothetical protein FN846DRAFT_547784 [Sphaerosporella brunnea]